MKRVCSVILILAMLLALVPTAAFAADGTKAISIAATGGEKTITVEAQDAPETGGGIGLDNRPHGTEFEAGAGTDGECVGSSGGGWRKGNPLDERCTANRFRCGRPHSRGFAETGIS